VAEIFRPKEASRGEKVAKGPIEHKKRKGRGKVSIRPITGKCPDTITGRRQRFRGKTFRTGAREGLKGTFYLKWRDGERGHDALKNRSLLGGREGHQEGLQDRRTEEAKAGKNIRSPTELRRGGGVKKMTSVEVNQLKLR